MLAEEKHVPLMNWACAFPMEFSNGTRKPIAFTEVCALRMRSNASAKISNATKCTNFWPQNLEILRFGLSLAGPTNGEATGQLDWS